MTKQVHVPLSIKTYHDEVLCDVAPMSASHLLLGRPWQFDKDVTYNGRKNTYSFMLNGKKVNLLPLSSQQVREDQMLSQQKEVKSRKGLLLPKRAHQTSISFSGGCFHDLGKAITTSRRIGLTNTD